MSDRQPELCAKCGEEPKMAPHPCPYLEQLYGDKTKCTCCENCTVDCADNI